MEVEKRIVVNGGMKLPIGYRFHPTEQELISFITCSQGLCFSFAFLHHPWDQKEKQRYFFCKKREVSSNEHRIKISSGDGYWKPIGKERPIIACGKTFGIRRTLAFYETNKSSSYCNKTRWSMTEYCLAGFASAKVSGEWAVYNVYERKVSKGRKQRKSREGDDEELRCIDHFTVGSNHETGPPPPSPPTSADE
ncbi:NAC domain [Arabidopsis thaliana x Arabidopsis arenosa]|uniref:NAC domain n=1 Tax=Arabidopsis thaliana x Arabidopsis arenosa TaxID=1240361 RepID=A0A8T1ZL29_9BRAS|nr:NAC domain [Arabidopsis thaliana x Arabidopsis arenosa]